MSRFFKRVIFWAILIVLVLGVVIFINGKIDKDYEIGDDVAYTEEEENRILE